MKEAKDEDVEEKVKEALTEEDGGDDSPMDMEEALAILADLFANPKYIKTMALLKDEEEAHKAWMMLSMSRRKSFKFLDGMARNKLLLSRSIKGAGSNQVVKVVGAFSGGGTQEEKLSVSERIKSAFKHDNFVDSGK